MQSKCANEAIRGQEKSQKRDKVARIPIMRQVKAMAGTRLARRNKFLRAVRRVNLSKIDYKGRALWRIERHLSALDTSFREAALVDDLGKRVSIQTRIVEATDRLHDRQRILCGDGLPAATKPKPTFELMPTTQEIARLGNGHVIVPESTKEVIDEQFPELANVPCTPANVQ